MFKEFFKLPTPKKLFFLFLGLIVLALITISVYIFLYLQAAIIRGSPLVLLGYKIDVFRGLLLLAILIVLTRFSRSFVSNRLKAELEVLRREFIRLISYDNFVEIYGKRGRIEVIDTPLGKLEIVEERSLLKDARDIRVYYKPSLYRPDILIEFLGGVRLIYEELIKEERICTRMEFPLRIKSWNEDTIEAEGVPYHYAYIFHYSPDLIVSELGPVSPLRVRDVLWKFLFDGKKMRPIEESPFPNHLGVHILPFTKDGYVVLLRRSAKGMAAARYELSLIDGSVSGGFEEKTLRLYDLAMEEIREELGVSSAKIYVVSYFRSARVMGRPSIGFIALLEATKNDLRESREGKIELVKVADKIEGFEDLKNIDLKKLYSKAKSGTPTLKWLVLKLSEIIGE